MPLYYWALETEADNELQLGYFNLPAVGADTGVQLMEGYSPDMHANAMACATAIVDRVQAGEFWPAREKVRYDEFDPILFGQVEMAAQAPAWGNVMSDAGSILGSEMIRPRRARAKRIGW